MNFKILLITLIALSVFVAGCGNKITQQSNTGAPINNQSDGNISKPKDTPTLTEQDNSTGNSKDSTTTQSKETFFGQWVIKKVIAYGPVGTYGEDDIQKVLGKKLTFSAEKATCFGESPEDLNKIIINPIYKKSVVTKNDFANQYRNRLTFDKLGITTDSIESIETSDAKGACRFFISNDNILILSGGGVYFELDRDTPN